ncbi:ABC transporter permease [Actinocrispum wychmicini]|uniref:Peptide/nickel transport system permease protein n=1 Tax=Actinocrispum wychmicini TaxID=1213861 RepID=A0A4R2J9D4_9PSEU|nr:ABC transporter permease [Actinocrispum wychmicini]TCO54847.1 peptide/nickel transport system permease protein [Actinocrispum wychmicini]
MGRYLVRRLVESLITLFLAIVVVFFGIRALPGDPARTLAGEEADPAAIAEVRHQYGFDQPLPVQFGRYIGKVFTGDLGTSVRTGLPVTDTVAHALPITVELALLAMLVAILIGLIAGVVAAVRRRGPLEWAANSVALLGLSIPNFWFGQMGILFFAISLGVLPASGFVPFFDDPADNLRHMVMPAIVLGSAIAAVIMRQTRSAMLESLTADFVRTARAKGLSRRQVVFGHALRNSLIVVTTIVGLQLGILISGAVVTESIFVLPGFGRLTLDAVFTRDYPLIQGVVLITATAYIVLNLLVDLLYSVIDPRIRIGGAAL